MTPHRELLVHIGASKTGTSSLQHGIFRSTAALSAQGLTVPLASRGEHVRRMLMPLGWRVAEGFTREIRPRVIHAFASDLAGGPGQRLLLTCEDLCEADAQRIELISSAFAKAGFQVRIVLTQRNLAAVVPSEYQQFLRHRMSLTYPEFLEEIRGRTGRWGEHFWNRQDGAAIARRFAAGFGDHALDVIITPDFATDPGGLARLFGAAAGFDPASLTWPDGDVNASWGAVEAELYRRVNVALRDRLGDYQTEYQPWLRGPLFAVLPRSASAKLRLPPEHAGWILEEAERQRDAFRAADYRIHGDLGGLVPPPDVARPVADVGDDALVRVAVQTIADLAVLGFRRERRRAMRGGD